MTRREATGAVESLLTRLESDLLNPRSTSTPSWKLLSTSTERSVNTFASSDSLQSPRSLPPSVRLRDLIDSPPQEDNNLPPEPRQVVDIVISATPRLPGTQNSIISHLAWPPPLPNISNVFPKDGEKLSKNSDVEAIARIWQQKSTLIPDVSSSTQTKFYTGCCATPTLWNKQREILTRSTLELSDLFNLRKDAVQQLRSASGIFACWPIKVWVKETGQLIEQLNSRALAKKTQTGKQCYKQLKALVDPNLLRDLENSADPDLLPQDTVALEEALRRHDAMLEVEAKSSNPETPSTDEPRQWGVEQDGRETRVYRVVGGYAPKPETDFTLTVKERDFILGATRFLVQVILNSNRESKASFDNLTKQLTEKMTGPSVDKTPLDQSHVEPKLSDSRPRGPLGGRRVFASLRSGGSPGTQKEQRLRDFLQTREGPTRTTAPTARKPSTDVGRRPTTDQALGSWSTSPLSTKQIQIGGSVDDVRTWQAMDHMVAYVNIHWLSFLHDVQMAHAYLTKKEDVWSTTRAFARGLGHIATALVLLLTAVGTLELYLTEQRDFYKRTKPDEASIYIRGILQAWTVPLRQILQYLLLFLRRVWEPCWNIVEFIEGRPLLFRTRTEESLPFTLETGRDKNGN